MPKTVRALLIANGIVFLLQMTDYNTQLIGWLGLRPALFWQGYLWQVVTYMFLHGGFWHIFFNMFVLWMFGRTLETIWGPKRFFTYYMICGVGAGLLNVVIDSGSPVPIIGASGAIYGLLLAFGVLYPNQMIYLWMVFPIKAKYFVIGLVVIELISGFNPNSPVAHFAHLGGMLFGFVYLKYGTWRHKANRWKSEQERNKHLKVVYRRNDEIRALQQEVDDLLDKINRDGLESLSARERQRLEEASRKLRDFERRGEL